MIFNPADITNYALQQFAKRAVADMAHDYRLLAMTTCTMRQALGEPANFDASFPHPGFVVAWYLTFIPEAERVLAARYGT